MDVPVLLWDDQAVELGLEDHELDDNDDELCDHVDVFV